MAAFHEAMTGRICIPCLGGGWHQLAAEPVGLARSWLVVKRGIDVAVAAVALAVFSPVFALVALGLKLASSAPLFAIEERVGRHGRPIRLTTFNTAAAAGPLARSKAAAVVVRARLDKLPLLVDVLRGDVSLVGPRPEPADVVARSEREVPYYRLRLGVRPGLVSWGLLKTASDVRSTADTTRRLEYDLYYVKHGSPAFDLAILVRAFRLLAGL
jgi:lipopolysaccharide/colanic/teichoic acid biosynthesis glycosyltransferase